MIDDFRSPEPATPKPEQNYHPHEATTAAFSHSPFTNRYSAAEPLAAPAAEPATEKRSLKVWFAGLSKKKKVLVGVSGIFVCLLVAGGVVFALRPQQQAAVVIAKQSSAGAPAGPTTAPSFLTGLPVDPSVNQQQVTGVMIENSVEARPQSGLDKAGVVYEAVAEGGITRFLALFQDTTADYIGPVRSVRPYYLQWCQSFDCAIAHVGGSPEALQNVKDWNIKNLDQFAGASFFQRVAARSAPHNVYTSLEKLHAYEASRGYTGSNFTGIDHLAKDAPVDPAKQNAKAISINYPGSAYDVRYAYDTASNAYKRSEGGAPHLAVDGANASVQISPKVVVSIAVPRVLQSDNKHNTYSVVGSGQAYVFQNGVATHATWTKSSPTAQITFADDAGTALKLNPGQLWISAVDNITDTTFN
jgi:hypothetical protein